MVKVVAGRGFNFSFPGLNFFQNIFDRSGFQTATLLNDPGSFNGFALDDTITIRQVGPNTSLTGIENYTGLAVDAGDVPTAGTLTALFATLTTLVTGAIRDLVSITGLNWSVAAMLQAGQTATTVDDDALYASAFSGNDSFDLSDKTDATHGYGGRDLMRGNGGNDRLFGDGAADRLFGGAGQDKLKGGSGADKIEGGTGADTSAGGGGADQFRFAIGDGADVITDFADGLDQIDVLSGATSFAAITVTSVGGDTVLQFGGVSVTLQGIDSTLIDAGDFLFH